MRNLKQHVSGSCPRGRNGSGAGGGNMRNLKQHVFGSCPRGRNGSGADMSHSAGEGRWRKHAELKNSMFPEAAPEGGMGAERT